MAAPSFTCVKIRCKEDCFQLFVDNKTLEIIKQDPTKYLNDIKASGFCSTLGKPFNLDPLTDQVFIEIGDTLPTVTGVENSLDKASETGQLAGDCLDATGSAPTTNGCAVSKCVKISGQTSWEREPILQLIELRRSFRPLFARPPSTKAKLWQQIADKMNEKGYRVTREECDNKWRNLTSTYKKNKEKVEKNGDESVVWEFFKQIDEIIGEDFSQPTPSNLSSQPAAPAPVPESSNVRLSKKLKKLKRRRPVHPTFSTLPALRLDEESSSSSSGRRSSSPDVLVPECVIPQSDSSGFKLSRLRKRKLKPDREPPAWFVTFMQRHDEEERTFRNECLQLERERLQVEKNKLGELKNRLNVEQMRVKELAGVKQLLTTLLEKLG